VIGKIRERIHVVWRRAILEITRRVDPGFGGEWSGASRMGTDWKINGKKRSSWRKIQEHRTPHSEINRVGVSWWSIESSV